MGEYFGNIERFLVKTVKEFNLPMIIDHKESILIFTNTNSNLFSFGKLSKDLDGVIRLIKPIENNRNEFYQKLNMEKKEKRVEFVKKRIKRREEMRVEMLEKKKRGRRMNLEIRRSISRNKKLELQRLQNNRKRYLQNNKKKEDSRNDLLLQQMFESKLKLSQAKQKKMDDYYQSVNDMKQLDYFVRALRMEERPLRAKANEERMNIDREYKKRKQSVLYSEYMRERERLENIRLYYPL